LTPGFLRNLFGIFTSPDGGAVQPPETAPKPDN